VIFSFCSPQDPGDELALRVGIAETVVAVLLGQAPLQRGILVCHVWVLSEVIAEADVIAVRLAPCDDDIELVRLRTRWPHEGLPPSNAVIPLIHIAERAQSFDGDARVVRRANDDIDVDHGLGSQAGNGRAADMLDLRSEVGNRVADWLGDLGEPCRPRLVVADDDDRRR
jgi:hypothetical protein